MDKSMSTFYHFSIVFKKDGKIGQTGVIISTQNTEFMAWLCALEEATRTMSRTGSELVQITKISVETR